MLRYAAIAVVLASATPAIADRQAITPFLVTPCIHVLEKIQKDNTKYDSVSAWSYGYIDGVAGHIFDIQAEDNKHLAETLVHTCLRQPERPYGEVLLDVADQLRAEFDARQSSR